MLNKTLKQQIEKYLKSAETLPELIPFLHVVSDTYNMYEKDHKLKENASDESSGEMLEINNRLRNQAAELEKAHSELGRIFNSVNQGFFSRDMITNQYIYLSQGCEKIYGYSVKEFFENSLLWFDVIYPEDRGIVARDNERLNTAEELHTQYRIIHKDNSIRWLELKVIPHLDNGKLTRVDGVVNDITYRKRVEAERESIIKELMKSNADLKQFSFITSHNLRAPLSNILGILNVLDYPDPDTYNGNMLDMLKESAQQLNKTIGDLTKILIIKNNVNSNLTSCNLQHIFDEVNKTFVHALEEAGGTVITDFKALNINQNKVYVESIFINLISNAIKYRSPNRDLLIEVGSSKDKNGDVVMRFTDNGIGIDLARHKDRVFGLYQRFHDTNEGQGLGLFIVKSQIEATGGSIDIESEIDKGTTFIIIFKKQPEQIVPAPAV